MNKLSLRFLIVLLLSLPYFARSQSVKVAVAANAQFVLDALKQDFAQQTGIVIEPISGSSGKLAAQIENGAPFDLFLSADMDLPEKLYREGSGLLPAKEYALGSLIVCSADPSLDLKNWKKLVLDAKVVKIAIANAAVAPYGKAAEEALGYYHVASATKSKLVYGESISQVNTYITNGITLIGFTTEALAVELAGKGTLNWVRVEPKAYSKIRQGALLLKSPEAANAMNARKFYNYLFTARAKAIFKRYGYRYP